MEIDFLYTLKVNVPDTDHVLECPGDVLDDPPSGAHGQVLDDPPCQAPEQMDHISPISSWLQNLGLSRYEQVFIREEIDWDSLNWLTDEVQLMQVFVGSSSCGA